MGENPSRRSSARSPRFTPFFLFRLCIRPPPPSLGLPRRRSSGAARSRVIGEREHGPSNLEGWEVARRSSLSTTGCAMGDADRLQWLDATNASWRRCSPTRSSGSTRPRSLAYSTPRAASLPPNPAARTPIRHPLFSCVILIDGLVRVLDDMAPSLLL